MISSEISKSFLNIHPKFSNFVILLDAYPMKCYSNAGDPCLFPAKDENVSFIHSKQKVIFVLSVFLTCYF